MSEQSDTAALLSKDQLRQQDVAVPFPWSDSDTSASFPQSVVKAMRKEQRRQLELLHCSSWLDRLSFVLPCLNWLRTYKIREYLLADLVAGLSVGFMLVPQSMSYATLAGLPVEYGLYGSFLPVIAYSLLGSSPHLAVGPVAVTSLLISNGLSRITPGYREAHIKSLTHLSPSQAAVQALYNHKATQLALLVAIMYTAVGVLRLGFLTRFLSHSVISGFTSGAAVIIALSQVKYILGFSIPQRSTLHENLHLYVQNIGQTKWREVLMGGLLLLYLLAIKQASMRWQRLRWLRCVGPLSASVIALLTVYIGGVHHKGIAVIGHIPKGLPAPTVDRWSPLLGLGDLLPLAGLIMVVDLMESTSIARSLADRFNYKLPYNREIVGLGVANFVGAAFHSYTTTGSFSRSALNADVGARTPLSGFVTGILVMVVLLFLTPVFQQLPKNVLGAIIISSVLTLVDLSQFLYLFKVNKQDWLVWMTSFLVTMFAGVELGLATAVGLALLFVVYESSFPHTARLGCIPGTTVYRNVKQYPEAVPPGPGILLMRIDAPIYFSNIQHIADRLKKYMARSDAEGAAAGVRTEFVVLELSPVPRIDATGVHWLEEVLQELRASRGARLLLSNPSRRLIRNLQRAGLLERLGRQGVFVRCHDAVLYCQRMLQKRQAAKGLGTSSSAEEGRNGRDVSPLGSTGSSSMSIELGKPTWH